MDNGKLVFKFTFRKPIKFCLDKYKTGRRLEFVSDLFGWRL